MLKLTPSLPMLRFEGKYVCKRNYGLLVAQIFNVKRHSRVITMIILVGGEKGGSGKSCLAQNIAVYLRTEKGAKVLMVDCDPQRTTSDWIQERKANPRLAPKKVPRY